MILVRIVLLPFRLAFKTTGAATKLGYRTGRALGYRRLFVFAVGVGVGLLVAPMPGRALRAKLREALTGAPLEPVEPVAAPTDAPVPPRTTAPLVVAGTNGHN